MTTLDGTIEHITFHNEQTRYTVARIKTGGAASVTVVGYLADALAGESVRLTGKWTTHPKYGQQFHFETADILLPATTAGIKKYLCAGFIRGIGPSTAEKIVRRFGPDTLEVIEKSPHLLTSVGGIGEKKAALIHEQWQSHHAVKGVMRFLQENGIKAAYSGKIYKTYGDDALEVLSNSPYRLANDIPGIGFYIADRIARNRGIETDEKERAAACILHLLRQTLAEGHTFVPADDLAETALRLFEIGPELTRQTLRQLDESGEIVIEPPNGADGDQAVYLDGIHQAETAIAEKIGALLSVPVAPLPLPVKDILKSIEHRLIIALSKEQKQVLAGIFNHRIAVLTGGPGTGKTTLIRSAAAVCRHLSLKICLAAPTGRAARRLSEVTGRQAHTIHKLLEYSFEDQRFGKNQDNPVDADIIIIDEASMIDTLLMYHLMNAIPFKSRLLMVGDAFQLPPVGPGNVLSDIIASDTVPVFYLETVFRQAAESGIVTNAHKVREGDSPELNLFDINTDQNAAFYFLEADTPQKAVNAILELCSRRLPERFGLSPVGDIQVLSPMHKGPAGTLNLNQKLQQTLNSASASVSNGTSAFKIGDKVMHLKNNYQKEVFNGDIGSITRIDRAEGVINVGFYGREVGYSLDELDELTLGYAISVHKSQGSEYPAVILPLLTQQYIMLQRNLLYTAITRAREIVVMVGSQKALGIALKNNKPQMRRTGLTNRLKQ